MAWTESDLLLVTGATGAVGSHVLERGRALGVRTRALVRPGKSIAEVARWADEVAQGELTNGSGLAAAVAGASHIVHCGSKQGIWGNDALYREVNVTGLERLLDAARASGCLRHFVHLSSLEVYEARDHHGTDESLEVEPAASDACTRSKIEAEQVIARAQREFAVPATIIRPGVVYGPRERTLLPALLERLRRGHLKFYGSGSQLMSNTYVENLVDAIFACFEHPASLGQIYNVTDARLVSKRDFVSAVARYAGYEVPRAALPLGLARVLTRFYGTLWRWSRARRAPSLSDARYRFLALHSHFSIAKARADLNYQPRVPFDEGMRRTMDWFREAGKLPPADAGGGT